MLCDVSHNARMKDGRFRHVGAECGGGGGLAVRLHFLCFRPLDANVIGQHWASIRQP